MPERQQSRRPRRVEASELEIGKALRERDDLYRGTMLAFDTFSGKILLLKAIPGGRASELPRAWHDTDSTQLMVHLQALGWVKVGIEKVQRAVQLEAYRNQFSAVVEYLDQLKPWDGVMRMRRFLHDVCGVEQIEEGMSDQEVIEYKNYVEEVSHIMFMSIVARAYRPGCKVDTMVVWEGIQGTDKSKVLRKLALKDEWFSDGMPRDLGTKDAKQHLRGKLVIEIAENAALKASRVEDIKTFLSAQVDRYRPPYGRDEIDVPRGCSFIGSTNESHYLDDMTGNRRFLPVRVGKINVTKATMVIEQCFAEAISIWKADDNVQWWIPPELQHIAEREQRSRLGEDTWERASLAHLATYLNTSEDHFFVEISTALKDGIGLSVADHEPRHMQRMGVILAKLGGVKTRTRQGKLRPWKHKFNVSEVLEMWEAARTDRPSVDPS